MQDERPAVFLSIRPRFAELILSGAKSVELRRVRPKVRQGDLVLLYASSPVRELIGVCTVACVEVAPTADLWRSHGRNSGLHRTEFNSYFEGAARSVAISLQNARRVIKPRTIDEIRERLPGFSPPQSFSYISHDSVRRLEIITEDETLFEGTAGLGHAWRPLGPLRESPVSG